MENTILLGHGSGGRLTHELIKELFVTHFDNPLLHEQGDSAILPGCNEAMAYTTDSYVVDPIFFPGGNIGKLAICGTVNDLAVSGAQPLYLSAGFIIEEGFPFDDLKKIVITMAGEAQKAGVRIVTGDTKVVNKGQCDKIFINTAGLGFLPEKFRDITSGKRVCAGDRIIINGTIADHGMAVMAVRNFASFTTDIISDCAPLNSLIKSVLDAGIDVKFMRDATRGGLATVLCELAESHNMSVHIYEEAVPINENVRGMCELLGFDPFYVANEGKVVMVVADNDAERALAVIKQNEFGKQAAIIGEINELHNGKAVLNTVVGGSRIIDMLAGEQLPRIC